MTLRTIFAALAVTAGLSGWVAAQNDDDSVVRTAGINIRLEEDVATVTINDQLFTRYYVQSGSKPILWPIYGPTGVEMTRAYPMRQGVEGERTDHPHHRSLWFAHGDVNGVNFWLEPDSERSRLGRIKHLEFLKVEGGKEPIIVTSNEWLTPDDEKVCSDVRTLRFGADEDRRWIDFDIVITNDTEEPLMFSDTKEGTFAVRVASWMKVDTEKGEEETQGRIVNSLGKEDKEAWGQPASWVDYHAEHDGDTLGIAILNHPTSYRFPTYWHVRTYGLFAANVFGLHNFKNSDEEDGSHELQPGESISFYYRVLFHLGDEQEGRVPEAFVEYAKINKASAGEERTAEDLTGTDSGSSEIELVDGALPAEPAPMPDGTNVSGDADPSEG